MGRRTIGVSVAALLAGAAIMAQTGRPMSPDGTAVAQVLGKWVAPSGQRAFTLGGATYQGGKWIEMTFGRPLRRGRDLWGAGAAYGKDALVGAPIWRAGANVTTRLKSEVPLVIDGKTVAAGEYSVFIDLKQNGWTLVLSALPIQSKYDPAEKTAVWGAYNYTPDKDVIRAPMTLDTLPHSHEQLAWEFLDMTDTSGTLALTWGNTMASVPFKVGS
jgi:Protein of unknown function (DUF2911)